MSETSETLIALFGTIFVCALFMVLAMFCGVMMVSMWQDLKRRMK